MAEIRKAAERDVLPVAVIYEHIISEEEAGRVCIGWQRGVYPTEHTAREAIAAGELFVMADGGEIVAAARINRTQVPEYADAQWEYTAPDDEIMVLHTLVVSPACAGRGYGTEFVHFYERYALENGYPYLRMDTNAKNTAARRLYARLGYKEVGIVDILVNNAGIIKRIPMVEMTAAEFRQVIDIDLNGPFIVSKAVIPSMIKKGKGKIINICSMMSELGRETVSAYAAAKGGLKMLTRNIASEYGEYNIQCNGIGPGYIATPQTAPLRERQADGSRHPFDSFIVAKTPAARWGTPEDLMGPAVFLASDASDFVNGHILYVDGGILAYIGKQPQ